MILVLNFDSCFVAGNVYTKSQLDLLKRLHERCQCHDVSIAFSNCQFFW